MMNVRSIAQKKTAVTPSYLSLADQNLQNRRGLIEGW